MRQKNSSFASYATFCLLTTIIAAYLAFYAPLPFISYVWENRYDQPYRFLDAPHRMADRIVDTNNLLGKSRFEIEELLGEPPKTDYFSDWDMVFRLGYGRGLINLDSEWLVIRLDADDKVIDTRIVFD